MSASLITVSGGQNVDPARLDPPESKQHYIVSDVIAAILMRADLATSSRERSDC